MTATSVRAHLIDALHADLVGPFDPSNPEAREQLELAPSRWYLTGFLAPRGARETHDLTSDDDFNGTEEDDDEQPGPENEAKQPALWPASMGMSVLLPPAPRGEVDTIQASVRFAEYALEPIDEGAGDKRKQKKVWVRHARAPLSATLRLDPATIRKGQELAGKIALRGKLEPASGQGLPEGTRALSLFVVNERDEGEKGRTDEHFIFQVELTLEYAPGFTPRPTRRGETSGDWDDKVVDLQFRNRCEWAVGHNVAVEAPDGPTATRLRTTWLPRHEVRPVVTNDDLPVMLKMEELADLPDGPSARTALRPLADLYAKWIAEQRALALDSDLRRDTRDELMRRAEIARSRIIEGIERLATRPDVLDAFRLANRAMATAARRRSPTRYPEGKSPEWRLFQLAFLLLNLAGIDDPAHADRENVELIFFPTGGGKTEAYLGVIAFTLLLRRIRGQSRPDKGLGVAVLLRYTLRLLTLDQLGRAATLICALEVLRRADPARLGDVRFSVGLWVGRSATANTMSSVKEKIIEYKNSASKSAPSPCPLTACPWCAAPLGRDSFALAPDRTKPREVVLGCLDTTCDFNARRNPEGIPVVFVDEPIYDELPAFLVATVDKFAMLPWRGETGKLFGRVSARSGREHHGPMDKPPKGATPLPSGLRPPELIVQDELHLISGPLGTMVGLYETAIESLSTHQHDGKPIRPKVIASTATVRRAQHQVEALFGRKDMALFPPPGADDADTWFAKRDESRAGRLYVGVAATGRSLKGILLRTYLDLLCGAARAFDAKGAQPADAYMTLVGYFNSLRELGGMRRLVEDDIRTRSSSIEKRHPVNHVGPHPWFRNRDLQREPVELTSRESTSRIADAKARLALAHAEKEHVDVVLASNMISVGVDIDRLGLMVVAGQPKTTSEYIQASSRVGRQAPGLVVTCFNVRKPRDRSHYERFCAYHASFYRFVEATSLTPFSLPALERGLAGALLAMARLSEPQLTPPLGVMNIADHRNLAERVAAEIAERAGRQERETAAHERKRHDVRQHARSLVDSWQSIVNRIRGEAGGKITYSEYDRVKESNKHLMRSATKEPKPLPGSDEAKFTAPTSMRDVEPSVHLWIERGRLGGRR